MNTPHQGCPACYCNAHPPPDYKDAYLFGFVTGVMSAKSDPKGMRKLCPACFKRADTTVREAIKIVGKSSS